MEAFATVEDLEARWRTLSDDEAIRAETLLADASTLLVALLNKADIEIDTSDTVQAANLKWVCCAMVKRVLASGDDGDYSQRSVTAGSYTEMYTYANSAGNLYLSAFEKKALGIGLQKLGAIYPMRFCHD